MRLYNTLTRRKDEFIPLKEGEVKMYVCGITPYDEPHLGHARCYVTFDVLRRYLEYQGYGVTYIQNITDIDDKIIERARMLKEEPCSLTSRYMAEFHKYMDLLNVKPASVYPRVSEHMDKIIEVISSLIDKGYAYRVNGDVYFEIDRFPGYGKLSGRPDEARLAGARLEIDPKKKNPVDFALWKSSKEAEPFWVSPWGKGRPGWHIECSVLSLLYLGETFDIHGGGMDLIFPHHENEIAQSEAYTGREMARFWIHNGFVMVNKEKMSKSLGNTISLKDILARFPPEVVRFFLLRTHYRNPIDFTFEGLDQAAAGLERFYHTLDNIEWELKEYPQKAEEDYPEIDQYVKDFFKAMDDDLNTSQALASLYGLAAEVNIVLSKKGKTEQDRIFLRKARFIFSELGNILGLFQRSKTPFQDQRIEALIKEREEARAKKDWAKADLLREELKSLGIILEDTPMGTRWKRV